EGRRRAEREGRGVEEADTDAGARRPVAAPSEGAEPRERRDAGERSEIRGDEHGAALEAVGDRAAEERRRDHREELDHPEDAERRGRARDLVDVIREHRRPEGAAEGREEARGDVEAQRRDREDLERRVPRGRLRRQRGATAAEAGRPFRPERVGSEAPTGRSWSWARSWGSVIRSRSHERRGLS